MDNVYNDSNQDCTITLQDLMSVVEENKYIKNSKENKKRHNDSLSSLINKQLSQSECIRLGIAIEKLLVDIILRYKLTYDNIKRIPRKGFKEEDHLFMDIENKVIYFAELKANLNLDTEKVIATYNKCLYIVSYLKESFPNFTIKWCLLGLRYLDYDDIPNIIKNKYSTISQNVYGINQYLAMLDIDYKFTQEQYIEFLNGVADTMFH